jgi:hypothetical protein
MLESTCAGARNGRAQRSHPALRQQCGFGPCAFGDPEDRPEVLRIFDPIERDQPAVARERHQLFYPEDRDGADLEQYALVRNAKRRLAVESFGCEFLYRDTRSSGAPQQIQHFRSRTSLTAAQQKSSDVSTTRAKRLAHRVDADQHLVVGPLPLAIRPVSRARLHAAFSRPGSRLVCGPRPRPGNLPTASCAADLSRAG